MPLMSAARLFTFKHDLLKQLTNLVLCRCQRLLARGGRPVDLAQGLAVAPVGRAKIALPFQAVQDWVERSGADAISVPRQLLEHAESEDRFFDGMVQNVQPDQSRVKLAVRNNFV